MEKKDWINLAIGVMLLVLLFLIGILVGISLTSNGRLAKENKELIEENRQLEIEVAVLETNESWWEDYIDVIEMYFEVQLEVYAEKLKNEPSKYETVVADFETTLELLEWYYTETDRIIPVSDWLEINYPALFERLCNYF